jgi:hypothetical protein
MKIDMRDEKSMEVPDPKFGPNDRVYRRLSDARAVECRVIAAVPYHLGGGSWEYDYVVVALAGSEAPREKGDLANLTDCSPGGIMRDVPEDDLTDRFAYAEQILAELEARLAGMTEEDRALVRRLIERCVCGKVET